MARQSRRVIVAAWQAPLLAADLDVAVEMIIAQMALCELNGVDILCCPEGIVGGLADNAHDPQQSAITRGELAQRLSSTSAMHVAAIVGFTERGDNATIYNAAAIVHAGRVVGVYRKLHPAIRHWVYTAGSEMPLFHLNGISFGIMICNDSNYPEEIAQIVRDGATTIFIPTNNALRPERADVSSAARHADVALAMTYNVHVVRADVVGECDGWISYGCTAISGATGRVLASAPRLKPALLISGLVL